MKKTILMLGFLFAIQINLKAQQEKQLTPATNFTTLKYTALPEENNFSKNSLSSGNNGPEKDYDYYMKKSKRSRNTGLILLGGGVLISGIGAILSFGNGQGYTYNESKGDAGAAMLLTGAAAGIASIPFMAVALGRSNKAKAMLSKQKTGFGVPSNVSKDITGVTLQIPLGK
jgi:hypothetical protein